ncbi:MAG: VIT domain-containing protein, partial [Verrucomicrobiota bacterium]
MKTRLRHLGNPVLLILLVLLVAAIVTARGTIADHPGPPEAGLAALIEEARNHQPLAAENAGEGDRCQLPFLRAKDGEALPLRSNNATVEINGVVAHVTLSQEFANPTDAPLNAAYVFPMSTRAAVHGLTMKIGDREIEGVIQEKNKARKTFNAAKKKGKRATLLEQERPNIFQTEVANIPAEGSIVVTITYTESLIPVSGEYSFVLPTTVVERYGENPEGERPDWSLNPYIQCDQSEADGTTASSTFVWDVNATIKGGLPISKAHCPSHKVKTTFINKTEVAVALDSKEKNSADRDFILNYRLTGDAVQSGLLIHKDKELEENFFLLTIQPPKRVAPEHIPPREYVFLVDFSGSMSGFPIEVSKAAMGNLLGSLRPQDRFNIVLFAGSSARMSPTTLAATPGNMRKAERWLDGHHVGGGTELLTGLRTAFDTFSHHDASKTMIVLTDGFVHFEKSAFTLIEQHLDEANVFALGIGKNVNRHCIEGMAAAGQGEPWIATNRSEALRVSSR